MNKTNNQVASMVRSRLNAGRKQAGSAAPRTMLALEPRFMFDAAGVATAADTAAHALPDDAYQNDAPDASVQSLVAALADHGPAAVQGAASQERTEIVFIDTAINEWAVLRDGVPAGVEVVLLDANRNGLEQMEQALAGRSGIDAIHVISHGSDGQLTLGNLNLNGGNVDAHADVLGRIGAALTNDGDLLLYGCDVGSDQGEAFITKIADATGADVAASRDATGAATLGGNWLLENTRGAIETDLAVAAEAQQAYHGLLAAGSLTFHVDQAEEDIGTVGIDLGTIVTDEMGVTDNIPGITYQIYTADDGTPGVSNGTSLEYWDGLLGDGEYGVQSGILGDDADGDPIIVIKSADGSEFDFRGIAVVNYLGAQSRVTIEGFRDGVSTGSVTLDIDPVVWNSTYGTAQLTRSLFQNVDEIRLTNPDEMIGGMGQSFGFVNYIAVQNLVFGEPVDPNKPVVDANGSAGGTANTTTFTENGPAVRIVTSDASLTDDDNITSMTFTLSASANAADEIIAYSAALNGGASLVSLGLSGSYDSTTRTYTVSGARSAAVYQGVMRALVYNNVSDAPDTTARTVTISVTDADGAVGQTTATINIAAVNDAPTATNMTQSRSAIEGGGAVALNDIVVTDRDGVDTITATLTLSNPAAGALSSGTFGSATSTFNAATGVWTVTGSIADVNAALAAVALIPSADNDQNFTITTRVRDAAGTGPADGTISVTVTPVNDAPVLGPTGSLALNSIGEDAGAPVNGQSSGTLVSALVGGISDIDSGALTGIAIVGADATQGRWWFSTDGGASWSLLGAPSGSAARLLAADARLHFEPNQNWNGSLPSALTIRAWDRTAGSNGGQANITVVGTGGTTPFSSATDTVSLTVNAVNDAPVATAPASISVTEDIATALTGISFSDVDAGSSNVTVTLSVPAGAMSASSGAGVTVGGTASALTLTGTVANINAYIAASNVTYTPASNDSGTRVLTVSINDGGNTGTGGSQSDTETVDLNITAVNDAPVATVPASISVTEDIATALTGISFSDVDAGSSNVTVTLSVPAGALSASSGAGVTVGGTASALTLTGTIANINAFIAASNVAYTPAANDTGTRVLTVSINDGGNTGSGGAQSDTETVDLNITAVNDAPVATAPASISIAENTATALTGISFSDVDAGSGNVTVTLSVPAGSMSATSGAGVTVGGTASALTLTGTIANINAYIAASNVIYSPAINDSGTRVLTVNINDGGNTGTGGSQSDTETVDLNISAVNDAPVATVPASISVTEDIATALTGISFSDVDAGSSNVTVTLSVPAGALSASSGSGVTVGGTASALTLTGTIADINAFIAASNVAYTSAANDTGTRVLTVSINDGGNTGSGGAQSDTETVDLNISAVNDAPVATAPASISVTEDTETALTGISFSDVDAGSDSVTVTLSVPAGTMSATSSGGVTVGGTASALTLTGSIANINAYIAASNVTYTPAANDTGTRVLTVSINDGGNAGSGGAQSDTQTVDLNVSSVNDAPVLTPGQNHALTATNEDTASAPATVADLLAGTGYGDSDAGALGGIAVTGTTGNGSWQYSTDGVTWTGFGTTSNSAALLLTATTQLRYVPDGARGETATLTFRAWDQTSGTASANNTRSTADTTTNGGTSAFSTATATASITVTDVNDAPTLVNLIAHQSVDEGEAFTFTVPANTFTDIDLGNTLTYSTELTGGGALPAWLSFDAATRTFSGTPGPNDAGVLSIDVTASDGNGGTATDTFTITVGAVNDAPVATVPTSISITEDTPTALTRISFADADAGSASVTVTLSVTAGSLGATSGSGVTVGGSAAELTLTGSIAQINAFIAASGVTYTPAANDSGSRTLTVDINDNGHSGGAAQTDIETVTLNISAVNDAPVVTVPTNVSIEENAATALTGISFADLDAGSNLVTATFSVPAGSLSATSSGGVVVGGTASALTLTGTVDTINAFISANGVTYTPELNDNGTRVLTVSLNDGGNTGSGGSLTDTQTVDLVIAPINDAPVATAPPSISITEDLPTPLTGISFADVDAGSSNVTVTFSVPAGALSATSGSGVTVGGSASSLTLTGTIADINAFIAASNVIYTPVSNDASSHALTVEIDDGGNTGNGGALSDSVTVSLDIAAVNDAPVATVPSSIAVAEDTPTLLTGISFADVDAGSADVTVTFSVPAGALSASSGSGVTVGGSASSLTLTGTIADINAFIAASNVTYTPPADDTGSHTLTIAIDDGGNTGSGGALSDSRTVTLNITSVNDAPTATNLTQTVTYTEDPSAPVALGDIVVTDSDAGDTITATLTLSDAAAGTLSTGTFGDATSSYNTSTGVWTVTGSVADVNAALAAVAFSPAANWDRNITITTRVRDSAGAGPADGLIALNVTPVNEAPVATGTIPAIEGRIDQTLHVILPSGLFSDVDTGDGLTLSVLNLPAGLTFDAATGTISGVPTGEPGQHELQLVATDGTGATANITFSVQIAASPSPPPPPAPPPGPPASPPPPPWVNMDSGSAIVPTSSSAPTTVAPGAAPMIPTPPTQMPRPSFSAPPPAFVPIAVASDPTVGPNFAPRLESAPDAPAKDASGSLGFLAWTSSSQRGAANIVVRNSPPDVAVEKASAASSTKIALPPRTFVAEGAREITIEASMADGRPLPSWVRFDPRDGSFTLDPPAGFEGSLDVRVTAYTEQGQSASTEFKIVVADKPDESSARGEIAQSKPSLSEQLRAAGEDGLLAEAAELLERLAEAAA